MSNIFRSLEVNVLFDFAWDVISISTVVVWWQQADNFDWSVSNAV